MPLAVSREYSSQLYTYRLYLHSVATVIFLGRVARMTMIQLRYLTKNIGIGVYISNCLAGNRQQNTNKRTGYSRANSTLTSSLKPVKLRAL